MMKNAAVRLTVLFGIVIGFISAYVPAYSGPNDSLEIFLSIGGSALKDHKYNEAIEKLTAALRLDSVNLTALRNLGAAYGGKGQNEQARVYLEKANRLKPGDAEICNNLGAIYTHLDLPSDAIKAFEEAVAADSTSALYLTNLGSANLKIGRIQKAEPYLRRAQLLSPKNPLPLFLIGNCYAAEKKYDSAVAYYDSSAALGGNDAELYYFLGTAKRQLGDFAATEKNLKKALEINPKYVECLQALGLLYAQQEKFVAAQPYFERAIKVDSTFYQAWIALGATAALTQQFARTDTILYRLFQVDSALGYRMLDLIQVQKKKMDARKTADSISGTDKK